MTDVITRYAPGTPAWADLMVQDTRSAQAFYGEVLGWQFDTVAGKPSLYHLALSRGRSAAGIIAPYGRKAPPAWMTYLATDDLDATLAAVERAGGMLAAPVFDLGEVARGAVVIDPSDAEIGIWEAGTHIGFSVVNEPGAVCWTELVTRDATQAHEFYRSAFGLRAKNAGFDDDYSLLHVRGRPVGGVRPAGETLPAGASPFWLTWFAVEDADVTAARATACGGSLLTAPADTPFGRVARLRDPWHATFAVVSTGDAETVSGW